MKLATKLTSILVAGIIVLLAVDGYLLVRRDTKIFEREMQKDARQFGLAARDLITDAWRTAGPRRTFELIESGNDPAEPVRIRWVWLDAKPDDPRRPAVSPAKLEALARGQEISLEQRDETGRRRLYTYVPIAVNARHPAALELSESLSELEGFVKAIVLRTIILIGVLALAGGVTSVILGIVMVGRPLNLLLEKVRRIGAGDLATPLQLHSRDEFSELAAALNTMCEQLAQAREKVRQETTARIEALEQLRHADRLRTVGRLASGIAHELGTPLNVVSGRAGLITRGTLPAEQVIENAAIIKDQAQRMTTIIRQLLDFARQRPLQKTPTDLRHIAHQSLKLLAPLAHKHGVSLAADGGDTPAMARVDAIQVQQALTNLVLNAVQATPEGGHVRVDIRPSRARPPAGWQGRQGPYLCISVLDEGPGISRENMAHIFEPFFTTKDVGEGTGLGLSIAHGIVNEHGGWIDVTSADDRGSCFSIFFPQGD